MSNNVSLLKTFQRLPTSPRVKAKVIIGLQDPDTIFPTPHTRVTSVSSFLLVSMMLTLHSHTGLITLQQAFRKSPTSGPLPLLFSLPRELWARAHTWLAPHLWKEIDIVLSLIGLIV